MSHYGPPPGGPYQPYPEHPERGGYESPSDPWGQRPDPWGGGQAHPPDYPPPPGYPEPGYPESGYPDPGYRDPRYPDPGYQDPRYPDTGYQDPRYPGPGYPPPAYDGPPPGYDARADDRDPPYRETLAHEPFWDERRPGGRSGLYATVAVLVVLAAAGVGYGLYVLIGDRGEPAPVATVGPTQEPSAPPATPEPSGTQGDNQGLNAAMAQVDDCLVNDGNAEETQMRIVRCDDEGENVVYRVLAVFNETVEGEDDATRHESAQALCGETEGYTHHYFEVGEEFNASFVLCMAEEAS